MPTPFKIFSGSASKALASDVSKLINIELSKLEIKKFSDGEVSIEIKEDVFDTKVLIIQSISAPANDNLIELALIADALKRAGASSIRAVIPYMGYARQDRRANNSRSPISAKLLANILSISGINNVSVVDLHSEQTEGFFNIPMLKLSATDIFLNHIKQSNNKDIIVVSPDAGGVSRARFLAEELNCNMSIIYKFRPAHNSVELINMVGDVSNKHCILVDDIIDTANTLIKISSSLKSNGAKSIHAYCTHPVLSGESIPNIEKSAIDKVFVTDSIDLKSKIEKTKKISVLSLSSLIAGAIHRIKND